MGTSDLVEALANGYLVSMSYPQQPQQPGYQLNTSSSGQPGYLPGPQQGAASGGGLAWTSLILAIIALIAGQALRTLGPHFASAADFSITAINVLMSTTSIGTGVVAAIGLVLALIAVRGSRKVLAGIAIGAHGITLASILFSMALVPLISLTY